MQIGIYQILKPYQRLLFLLCALSNTISKSSPVILTSGITGPPKLPLGIIVPFFYFVDDFDDDSITVEKIKVQLPSWLSTEVDTSDTQFWSERYRAPELPPWEMGRPTPALVDALAQLKLNKCRILVPGCGSGHDAAYLAQQGHIVTAVDYSPEAVALAQEKYGDIKNLTIRQSDVFNLDQNHWGHYDLIVEHTLFCAIPPQKRALLVEKWTKYLNEGGHLLAVFFVKDRKNNPPFGATEWELRQRLRKKFEFLYWTRWKQSEDWKKSVELVIYAKLWQSTPHFQ